MSEPSPSHVASSPAASRSAPAKEVPERVFLVAYPKVVFLYPSFLASILTAIYMSFVRKPFDAGNEGAVIVAAMFLGILAVNFVILAFDFPRTTSLTLFFFAVAVATGFVLLVTLKPELLPHITHLLAKFRPAANATFYWAFAAMLAVIFLGVSLVVRFDYWEVRPNELLHHHGFLSNLERLSAPNLRIDKEINDVFEYILLRSGRLILQASNERRAIVLDNVPYIKQKEDDITRMLGALQVEVRSDTAS